MLLSKNNTVVLCYPMPCFARNIDLHFHGWLGVGLVGYKYRLAMHFIAVNNCNIQSKQFNDNRSIVVSVLAEENILP